MRLTKEVVISEHDEIILDQLYSARKIKKKLKKFTKIMKNDPAIEELIESNNKRIDYLEKMLYDKSLLNKKYKKKKGNKPVDVLGYDPKKEWYRFCRDCMYYTMFNYKIAKDYMSEYYVTWFRK